jgi:lysophospholipase L1-like esterase
MSTVIYDGTFPGADTTPDATPNSGTALVDVASVGTSGLWRDLLGGHWAVKSARLAITNSPPVVAEAIWTGTPDADCSVTLAPFVGDYLFVRLRRQSGGQGYRFYLDASQVQVGTTAGSAHFDSWSAAGFTGPFTFTCSCTGASPTTLFYRITDSLGATVATASYTDSTAGIQVAGQISVHRDVYDTGAGTFVPLLGRVQVANETTSPLFQAPPAVASTTAGPSLSWASATGGVAPYTYRVHRSPYADTPPDSGTALTAFGSATALADTPPDPAGIYEYAVEAKDAAAATAVSTWVGGTTRVARNVVLIGDSTTDEGQPRDRQVAITGASTDELELALIAGLRAAGAAWTLFNIGWDGSATADWLPTAGNASGLTVGGVAANRFTLARKVITGSGTGTVALPGTTVILRLGTNDAGGAYDEAASIAAANAGAANVGTIAAALAGYGAKVVICDILYSQGTYNPRFWTHYRPALDALAGGTSILRLKGDHAAFAADQTLLADGTHPTAAGRKVMGTHAASALFPAASGPTLSARRIPILRRGR